MCAHRAPEDIQQVRVVFIGQRKPARSQRRAGRFADLPDPIRIQRQQIHQIAGVTDQPAVPRSVEAVAAPPPLFDESRQAGVDDGRGAAAMSGHNT
jgi:hypothetical protein